MTERERLIELIKRGNDGYDFNSLELIADYLLENGVIIPSFKVGDTVYSIDVVWHNNCDDYDNVIEEIIVTESDMLLWLYLKAFGKTIFLTKEEAEAAFKEEL